MRTLGREEGKYSYLTQYGKLNIGFWKSKSEADEEEWGIYNKDEILNLTKLSTCDSANRNAFSFKKGADFLMSKVAVVSALDNQALINSNGFFLLPFDCKDDTKIELSPIKGFESLSIATVINTRKVVKKCLIRDGLIILKICDDIIQLNNNRIIKYLEKDKWGLSDVDGKVIHSPEYAEITEHPNCNLFTISKLSNTGREYGLMNTSGQLLVPCVYSSIKYCQFGLISAKSKDGKWHIFDYLGNFKISHDYDNLVVASKDYIIVTQKNKMGIISIQGKEYLPLIFDDIFFEGSNYVCRMNGKGLFTLIESGPLLKCNGGNCGFYKELIKELLNKSQ